MNTPEWLKPGVLGAVVGAALVTGVGFASGGLVTGTTARESAMTRAHDDVIAALVPVCLDKAGTDPQRVRKLETIRTATSYKQRDALMDTGWATMPGSAGAERDLAQACLKGLDLDAS